MIPACDFDRGSGLGAVGRIIPRGLSGQCWICPAQQARPETSSGTQTEKLLSGEYTVGFFISAAPAYPVVANSGGRYVSDAYVNTGSDGQVCSHLLNLVVVSSSPTHVAGRS